MKNKNIESFGEFNESVYSDKGHAGRPGEMYDGGSDLRQLIIDRINQIYTKSSGPRLDLNVSDKELFLLFENLLRRLYQQ